MLRYDPMRSGCPGCADLAGENEICRHHVCGLFFCSSTGVRLFFNSLLSVLGERDLLLLELAGPREAEPPHRPVGVKEVEPRHDRARVGGVEVNLGSWVRLELKKSNEN